jgi:hypothetical protein
MVVWDWHHPNRQGTMKCDFCRGAIEDDALSCRHCRKLTEAGRTRFSKRVVVGLWVCGVPLAIIVALAFADHIANLAPTHRVAAESRPSASEPFRPGARSATALPR